MFKISKAASAQLKHNLTQHDFDDLPLRVAARQNDDGTIEYQMGFDEAGPGDLMVASRGIDVVIAKDHLSILNGTELDYVLMDDGERHFIFMNPNDSEYVPPDLSEDSGTGSGD